eukprot:g5418.t1
MLPPLTQYYSVVQPSGRGEDMQRQLFEMQKQEIRTQEAKKNIFGQDWMQSAHLRAPLRTRLVHELAVAPRTLLELQELLRVPGEASPPMWELKKYICQVARKLALPAALIPLLPDHLAKAAEVAENIMLQNEPMTHRVEEEENDEKIENNDDPLNVPDERGFVNGKTIADLLGTIEKAGFTYTGPMIKPPPRYDLKIKLYDSDTNDSGFSLNWEGYDYETRKIVRRRKKRALSMLRLGIGVKEEEEEKKDMVKKEVDEDMLPLWLHGHDLRTRTLHTLVFEAMPLQTLQKKVRVPGRPVPSTRKLFLAMIQVAEKAGRMEDGTIIYDLTPPAWDEVKEMFEREDCPYDFKSKQIAVKRMKAARYKSHQLKMARRKRKAMREKERKLRLLVLNREKIKREQEKKKRDAKKQ